MNWTIHNCFDKINPIPFQVNVWMAVMVLPLNSALNPFIYTMNVIMEKRRHAQESKLRRYIITQLAAGSIVKP